MTYYNETVYRINLIFIYVHLLISTIVLIFISTTLQEFSDFNSLVILIIPFVIKIPLRFRENYLNSLHFLDSQQIKSQHILDSHIRILIKFINLPSKEYENNQNGMIYEKYYCSHVYQCQDQQCFCIKYIGIESIQYKQQTKSVQKEFMKEYIQSILNKYIYQNENTTYLIYNRVTYSIQILNQACLTYKLLINLQNNSIDSNQTTTRQSNLIANQLKTIANRHFQLLFDNQLNIKKLIYYDQQFNKLKKQFGICVQLKLKILEQLCQNSLSQLYLKEDLEKFLQSNDQSEEQIDELYDLNPKDTKLQKIIQLFNKNISFNRNAKQYDIKQTSFNKNIKEQFLFNGSSFSLFSTILHPMGQIKYISGDLEDLFSQNSNEISGKNISIFIPDSINTQHDKYITQYIKFNQILKSSSKNIFVTIPNQKHLIFLANIYLQLGIYNNEDIGIYSFIQKDPTIKDYILGNENGFIQGVTYNIWEQIFSKSILNLEQFQEIELTSILPLFTKCIDFNDKYDEQFETQNVQTIILFPKQFTLQNSYYQKRLSMRSRVAQSDSLRKSKESSSITESQTETRNLEKLYKRLNQLNQDKYLFFSAKISLKKQEVEVINAKSNIIIYFEVDQIIRIDNVNEKLEQFNKLKRDLNRYYDMNFSLKKSVLHDLDDLQSSSCVSDVPSDEQLNKNNDYDSDNYSSNSNQSQEKSPQQLNSQQIEKQQLKQLKNIEKQEQKEKKQIFLSRLSRKSLASKTELNDIDNIDDESPLNNVQELQVGNKLLNNQLQNDNQKPQVQNKIEQISDSEKNSDLNSNKNEDIYDIQDHQDQDQLHNNDNSAIDENQKYKEQFQDFLDDAINQQKYYKEEIQKSIVQGILHNEFDMNKEDDEIQKSGIVKVQKKLSTIEDIQNSKQNKGITSKILNISNNYTKIYLIFGKFSIFTMITLLTFLFTFLKVNSSFQDFQNVVERGDIEQKYSLILSQKTLLILQNENIFQNKLSDSQKEKFNLNLQSNFYQYNQITSDLINKYSDNLFQELINKQSQYTLKIVDQQGQFQNFIHDQDNYYIMIIMTNNLFNFINDLIQDSSLFLFANFDITIANIKQIIEIQISYSKNIQNYIQSIIFYLIIIIITLIIIISCSLFLIQRHSYEKQQRIFTLLLTFSQSDLNKMIQQLKQCLNQLDKQNLENMNVVKQKKNLKKQNVKFEDKLSKFSIKYIFSIILLILAQQVFPIYLNSVSSIFYKNQKNNLDQLAVLQLVKGQLSINQATEQISIFSIVQQNKFLIQKFDQYRQQLFQQNMNLLQQLYNIQEQLKNNTQNQDIIQIYQYILFDDMCQLYDQFPEIKQLQKVNLKQCQQNKYSEIMKDGLVVTLKYLFDYFQNEELIFQNQQNLNQFKLKFKEWDLKRNVIQINEIQLILEDMIEVINQLLILKIKDYYQIFFQQLSTIYIYSILLYIVLLLLWPVYVNIIQDQFKQTQKFLTIFQIEDITHNPYIMSYLEQKYQTKNN